MSDPTRNNSNKKRKKNPVSDTNTSTDRFYKQVVLLSNMELLLQSIASVLGEIGAEAASSAMSKHHVEAINELEISVEVLSDAVDENITLCQGRHLSREYKSKFSAEENNEKKRQKKLHPHQFTKEQKKIVDVVNYLKKRLELFSAPTTNTKLQEVPSPKNLRTKEAMYQKINSLNIPPPKSKKGGEVYTVREFVEIYNSLISPQKISLTSFYNYLNDKKPPQILSGYSTLARSIKRFNDEGVLPPEFHEGIECGRPRLVNKNKVPEVLNSQLRDNPGYVQRKCDLKDCIIEHEKNEKKECNKFDICSSSKVVDSTLAKYNFLGVYEDDNITACAEKSSLDLTRRRQQAAKSIRSCMSQVAGVIVASFMPGTFEYAKGTPETAKETHKMYEKAIGIQFAPRHPACSFNLDVTQYYAKAGINQSSSQSSNARTTTDSYQNRGTVSLYKDVDDTDSGSSGGIRMKWCAGSSGSGESFPICCYCTLPEDAMPTESFVVIKVKGLHISSEIDPDCDKYGYLCFIKKNTPQVVFFKWLEEEVTFPTVKNLRKKYSIPDNIVSIGYIDSDTTHLKHIIDPDTVRRNVDEMKTEFFKIGAKITSRVQALDVCDNFKTQKQFAKKNTMVGQDSPLKTQISQAMAKLRQEKKVMLPAAKVDTIIDNIACAPAAYQTSYTPRKIKESWEKCGNFDRGSHTLPDMYAIMDAFSIKWTTTLRNWFIQEIPECLKIMYLTGDIPESHYDKKKFPVDQSVNGDELILSSNALHLRRSMLIYSPHQCLSRQQAVDNEIQKKNEAISAKQESYLSIIEDNKKCEDQMLSMKKLGPDSDRDTVFSTFPLKVFAKPNAPLLTAFIKMRSLADLSQSIQKQNKGTLEKIEKGEINECLILTAFSLRDKKRIGKVPDIPSDEPVSPPQQQLPSPYTMISDNMVPLEDDSFFCESWINNCFQNIRSLSIRDDAFRLRVMSNIPSKKKVLCELSDRLWNRLVPYLACHIPEQYHNEMMPGNHWVWDSFRQNLMRICGVMILSEHCVEELHQRKNNDSLLNPAFSFVTADTHKRVAPTANGCYLVYDTKRSFICSDVASGTFDEEWSKHRKGANRSSEETRKSVFYSRYPNLNATAIDKVRQHGYFHDLVQYVGVSFHHSESAAISDLFLWDENDVSKFNSLALPGKKSNDVSEKKHHHLCELFNVAYTLALKQEDIISESPGCEWQLKYSKVKK